MQQRHTAEAAPSFLARAFSITLPTPGTLRTGSGAKKESTASRDQPVQNWPSGLRTSAAIFASRKLGPIPAEVVSPRVASLTLARISPTTTPASSPSAHSS